MQGAPVEEVPVFEDHGLAQMLHQNFIAVQLILFITNPKRYLDGFHEELKILNEHIHE